MTIEGNPPPTKEIKKQGYKNPLTRNAIVTFNENAQHNSFWEKLKTRFKYPIKLSPSQTEKLWEKISQAEAEELWGPTNHSD